MTMTMTTTITSPVAVQHRMFEILLSRGNRACLVTVHRKQITKVTPIKNEADVCAGVDRPRGGALIDNGEMFNRLLTEPYGEYVVTVCYGKITSVLPVVKDEAVKVQDFTESIEEVKMQDFAEPTEEAKPTKKKPGN